MRWLVLVALLGCSKKIEWNAQKLTTITAGPFTAPIPAGWRDLSELADKDLADKELGHLPPDTRMIVPAAHHDAFTPNILVGWLPATGEAALPCDQVAASTAQGGAIHANAQGSTADGDKVCTWTTTRGTAAGTATVRFHGDHMLLVECLHAQAGDPATDAACTQVTSSLRPR